MRNDRQTGRRRSGRRCLRGGLALIAVITLVLVVELIIVGMVLAGGRDQDLTVRRIETVRAFYACEGGMNMAIREMMLDSDEDGDGGVGSIASVSFSEASIVVATALNGGATTLTSTGTSGLATRKTQAVTEIR